MNCSEVEKFLPLYAGYDLSAPREQLIAAHLKSCMACSVAATEYRDARALMSHLTPPVFSDEVFVEIRKNVWRQIETESRVPTLLEAMAAWFQPRFVLTAAAALLITLSVVGVYFLTKRSTVRPTLVSVPETFPQPDKRSGERLGPVVSKAEKGITGQYQADVPKRRGKPDHLRAPDRANSLVAYSPDAQAADIEFSPVVGIDDSSSAARDVKRTLRMEIQTKNPNIRIIWFAQKEAKPLAVHSKGI